MTIHRLGNGKGRCMQFHPQWENRFRTELESPHSSCNTEFHTTWRKRRYADSHASRFRTIFGWKAMCHSTCHEIIVLIALVWSLTIFAYIWNCLQSDFSISF